VNGHVEHHYSLTFSLASGQSTNKKFNPPAKKKDRMRYSLEELRLLSFVIRCFDNGHFSAPSGSEGFLSEDDLDSPSAGIRASHIKNGTYCLTLTSQQIGAISDLNDRLADSAYNDRGLSNAIDVLAEMLYMPDNSEEMMSNIFVSPVMAFACLRAIAVDGGFLPPKSITGNLVALQCAIRLCIFFVVMKLWRRRKATGGKTREPDGDWFRWVPCVIPLK
jgi:hypothetical protein